MKAKHILKVNLLFMAYAFLTSQGSAEIQFKVNEGAWSETPDFENVSGEVVLKVKDTDKRQFFVWDGLPSGYEFQEEDRSIVKFTMPATAPNINCWSIPTSVYEPLKSIETTGSNWIDTGLKAVPKMTVRADIAFLSGKIGTGAFGTDDTFMFGTRSWSGRNWNNVFYKYGEGTDKDFDYNINQRAVYTYDSGVFFHNGVSKSSEFAESKNESEYNILLSNVGGGSKPAILVIYSFSIKHGGEYKRNMVPVRRKIDGELGMYDVVSGKLHTAQGTGDFIAGPEEMLSKKYNSAKSGWGICLKASGYNGASTLTGVPVLVRISENIPGFRYSKALDGGLDIFFATDEKGENRLAHDIDTWNKEGTSLVWVKLPKLSGKETKFYMFYGSKEVAMCPASTEVWSSYITVLHMDSYGENGIVDETGHGNNAVLINAEPNQLIKSTGAFGSTTLRTVTLTTDFMNEDTAPQFTIPNYDKFLTNQTDVDETPDILTAMVWWKSNWSDSTIKWWKIFSKLAKIESYRTGWFMELEIKNNKPNLVYAATVDNSKYATEPAVKPAVSCQLTSGNDKVWNFHAIRLSTDGKVKYWKMYEGYNGDIEKVAKCGKSGKDITMTGGEYDEVRITRESFSDDRIKADYEMMKNSNFVVPEGESYRLAKGFSITVR